MKVYELHWGGEPVCTVVAPTPSKAKSIAMKESVKARRADYLDLNCRQAPRWIWEGMDLSFPHYVWDFETYQDMMDEELAWYWSQQ